MGCSMCFDTTLFVLKGFSELLLSAPGTIKSVVSGWHNNSKKLWKGMVTQTHFKMLNLAHGVTLKCIRLVYLLLKSLKNCTRN